MKSLLFVDDEQRVLQGIQRQLRPMRAEWDMNFVDGGLKALEFMASHPVDVVVSDMLMPGMDGAQLLDEVSRLYPGVVRVVLSGHTDREATFRLVGPAHQYLSKPCESDQLRSTITRAFALRNLLDNDKLRRLAARIKCLPSLPQLYVELTEELRREDSNLDRASDIISRDIGMTTKILQLVNSAFFGLPQPISVPGQAVMFLGMATVRSLVLSLQVFSQFPEEAGRGFSLKALESHSWTTAVFSRRLAQAEGMDEQASDHCFLAGLLHDVGMLLLASGLPEEYAAVSREAKLRRLPLWQAEQSHFGATHAEVGAYLIGLWALPGPVIEAIALHHRPAGDAASHFSPAIVVHVADVFAHTRCPMPAGVPVPLIDPACLAALGKANRLEAWKDLCLGDSADSPLSP